MQHTVDSCVYPGIQVIQVKFATGYVVANHGLVLQFVKITTHNIPKLNLFLLTYLRKLVLDRCLKRGPFALVFLDIRSGRILWSGLPGCLSAILRVYPSKVTLLLLPLELEE